METKRIIGVRYEGRAHEEPHRVNGRPKKANKHMNILFKKTPASENF